MGILDRPFAAIYDKILESSEVKWLRAARQDLLSNLTGEILEVGAGTGANFAHYSPQAHVTAIEPSPHFLKRAQAKLPGAKASITLEQSGAEALPFDDNTFDAAVGTLVFCTIPDPLKALLEVRRVTKPGAPLLMIEHVQADTPGKRLFLNLWTPFQRIIAGGCSLNRDTVSNVTRAGFKIEESRVLIVEMGISPHLYVRATNTKRSP